MSISRVNASGWSVGEKLTSAQQNSLDANTSYALDKRAGQTDTLSSDITVASGADLTFASGSTAVLQSGAFATIESGAAITIEPGGEIALDGGGVIATSGGGGTIRINSGGALEFNNSGYPALVVGHPGRSRTYFVPAKIMSLGSGWSVPATNISLAGPNSTSPQTCLLSGFLHNGATLAKVKPLFWVTNGSHAGVPAALPTVNVLRYAATAGSAISGSSLYSGGITAFPTPGSAGAWEATGNLQTWDFTCDQNNVINTQSYMYLVSMISESGVNSINAAFNLLGFILEYNSTTDMRFP